MRRQPGRADGAAIVDAIVTAAERVREDHGLEGFSTNRVAELGSKGWLNHCKLAPAK